VHATAHIDVVQFQIDDHIDDHIDAAGGCDAAGAGGCDAKRRATASKDLGPMVGKHQKFGGHATSTWAWIDDDATYFELVRTLPHAERHALDELARHLAQGPAGARRRTLPTTTEALLRASRLELASCALGNEMILAICVILRKAPRLRFLNLWCAAPRSAQRARALAPRARQRSSPPHATGA